MPRAKRVDTLPVMPLRSTVVYPSAAMSVQIGMESTLAMLEAHQTDALEVVTVVDPGDSEGPVDPRALEKIGVRSRITDRLYMPGGSVQATVQGLRRVRIRTVERQDGHFVGQVEEIHEKEPDPAQVEDTITRILSALEALAAEVERISDEVPAVLRMNVGKPGRFADLVATLSHFTVTEKDEVLQRLDVGSRLRFVLRQLEGELAHLRERETGEPAPERKARPREQATDLRRRIKRLQAELGQIDPAEREVVQLLRRIETMDLPPHVGSRARQEVDRLRSAGIGSPEAEDIRTYVDWLLHMPWEHCAAVPAGEIDLDAVRAALDERLLGLEEPKERLLDDLAVARLRGDLQGPIPCIVGPPDVGKSSLVTAVAEGLGRALARIELRGRGEADLIGTRRTQRDARPGKIAGALRDNGVCDPVLVLDEVDLVGVGKVEGDPVEALEEALQWEHRAAFVDRYLDVAFDLSRAVVLAVAQDFQRIPRDLREMMVEIRIAGYTPEEKVAIARHKLLPRMIDEHGLRPEDVRFDEGTLYHLVRGYARDAGLERTRRVLAALLRTRARSKAEGEEGTWGFEEGRIEHILGPARYVATPAESAPEVGVVTGLAWTAAGGELLFIEALRMAGTGRLIITGYLGDVMRESVNAAYSYVRSRATELRIPDDDFGKIDVHVHFPVGAVPKDGPSAGVAVTLAVASTLSGLPVRHDIAMTGEVTLRGKVLEVGGIKEKVLAAYRAGIRTVILPAGNERDLREVPEETREKVAFHFVERMDEVLSLALIQGPKSERARAGRKSTRKKEERKKDEDAPPRSEKRAARER
ncbi:MAG TPA: S16 family serine protease [Longimicrobiales bacterium]|nr:S16 family serine protease [Longimicrobiales bacterium]